MPGAHRHDDRRYCLATTIVEGQTNVRVNGKLWAVENDPDSHGLGLLEPIYGALNVRINGKKVICAHGDRGGPDNGLHISPATDPDESSTNVFVYGR